METTEEISEEAVLDVEEELDEEVSAEEVEPDDVLEEVAKAVTVMLCSAVKTAPPSAIYDTVE